MQANARRFANKINASKKDTIHFFNELCYDQSPNHRQQRMRSVMYLTWL